VRKDDNPEAFKTRLEAYRAQTAPLSNYYEGKGMLIALDGMQPIDDVSRDLFAALDAAASVDGAANPR
jgi:adenylate kinase